MGDIDDNNLAQQELSICHILLFKLKLVNVWGNTIQYHLIKHKLFENRLSMLLG